jgi:hypothetical protein
VHVIGNFDFGHADFDEGECFLEDLIGDLDAFCMRACSVGVFRPRMAVDDWARR